jgi:hypothetical protein
LATGKASSRAFHDDAVLLFDRLRHASTMIMTTTVVALGLIIIWLLLYLLVIGPPPSAVLAGLIIVRSENTREQRPDSECLKPGVYGE